MYMFTVTAFASCDNLINHNNKTCLHASKLKLKLFCGFKLPQFMTQTRIVLVKRHALKNTTSAFLSEQ